GATTRGNNRDRARIMSLLTPPPAAAMMEGQHLGHVLAPFLPREAGMKPITWTLSAAVLLGLLGPAAAAEPERLALARRALAILETNCHGCHGKDGTNEGGFNYVLDAARLVARKKVVPGDAGRSKLYKRLTSPDNPMPPEDEKVRPGKED